MEDVCIKCRKKKYLNEDRLCFDCVELPGKVKITRAKKITNPKRACVLFLLCLLLNNFLSYYVFSDNVLGMQDHIGYLIIMVLIDIYRLLRLNKWYPIWQEPILNVAGKYIIYRFLARDIYGVVFENLTLLISWNIFLIISICIQEIGGKKKAEAYKRYLAWEKDKILQGLDQIPEIEPIEWILDDKVKKYCMQMTRHYIEQCSLTQREKDELYSYFGNNERCLKMDNNMKYYYCLVLDKLIENNMPYPAASEWLADFPMNPEYSQLADYMNVSRYQYITKNFYKLAQRMRTEILQPYQCFSSYEASIKQALQDWKRDYISISLGIQGEQRVENILQEYEGQIITIPNLRLEVEGKSVENDFIVISPYGIYVLEVKNLGSGGGYRLHIEKDGRWSKVYNNRTEPMNSVFAQNERHVLYLEKYLNQKLHRPLDEYLRIQGMIVIANDKVDITNETDDLIVRYNNVMNTIKKNPIIMKETQMKEIAALLKEVALPALKYEVANSYWSVYLAAEVWKKEYTQWKNSIVPVCQTVNEYLQNNKI